MPFPYAKTIFPSVLLSLLPAIPAAATPFSFSTGDPDGKIATATRPDSAGKFEIESADDFILSSSTAITGASFTGLITGASPLASIGQVRVEIYRVFPNDSDTARTSFPVPPFSTAKVPARQNSPSDVEFANRDTAAGNLAFTTTDLGTFAALNSVMPGGIHPIPGQTTGGNGPITGEEVRFDVDFSSPFSLPADHYFFVPQVEITTADGDFFWLSAPKPITGGTGPFAGDLQSWTRDQFLDPDWLRIGTDIVDTTTPPPTFNATFSLTGDVAVPEPASLALLGTALGIGLAWRMRARA